MKNRFIQLLCVLICLSFSGIAVAESITINGTVSGQSENIISHISGMVEDISVKTGQRISQGEILVSLKTEKVYAEQSGRISLFGQVGDNVTAITNRYGAVAYIEPDYQYSISATTKSAYANKENYIIHVGETVYLRCYSDNKHKGTGIVTTVSGESFTVEITSGSFEHQETVTVYRSNGYKNTSRIGRGSISRLDPIAYTSEGTIVKYHAKTGSTVKKGDLLFETITGSFDKNAVNNQIKANKNGVVQTVNVVNGDTVAEAAAVLTYYPDDEMRIKALVSESELSEIQVGQAVKIEFVYLTEENLSISGTVEAISLIPEENTDTEEEEVSYIVTILPAETEMLRYGMNVIVTTVEDAL